jgi:type IV pilus assembly protein PilF
MRRTLLILPFLLAACVTEGPAVPAPEPELTDAATLNVQLGYEYMRLGKRADAVKKFERAVEQDSDNANARLGLALVYEQAGDFREARKHYRDAVARAPKDPAVLNAWGTFQCRQKEFAGAEESFLEAARTVTYRTPELAWTNAGVCARRAGDSAKAERYLREALRVNDKHAEALYQLADLSFERNEPLKTRAFLERHFEIAPASPPALLLAWRAERALEDQRAAQRYADRLRRDFPASDEVRQLGGGR